MIRRHLNSSSKKSILIVDDEEQTRQLLIGVLEACGYRVWATDHPERALMIAQNTRVDLAIVDMFPAVGARLVERLSELHRDIRIIYIAAAPPNANATRRPAKAEPTVLIFKPFRIHTMIDAVIAAIGAP